MTTPVEAEIVEEPTTAVATTGSKPPQLAHVGGSPVAMMEMALASGQPLDNLEKLMVLQERYEANEAKKAFVKAMAAFKADPPKIIKDQKVEFQTSNGQTQYDHASLAEVTSKINGALSQHGLSAGWITAQRDGQIFVTCTMTHDLGHAENTTLSAAPDASGGKNSIQAIGSTVSYLQRYTLLALTGLATHENENDGKPPVQPITPEQVQKIEAALKAKGRDKAGLLKFLGLERLEDIPANWFQKTMDTINQAQAGE